MSTLRAIAAHRPCQCYGQCDRAGRPRRQGDTTNVLGWQAGIAPPDDGGCARGHDDDARRGPSSASRRSTTCGVPGSPARSGRSPGVAGCTRSWTRRRSLREWGRCRGSDPEDLLAVRAHHGTDFRLSTKSGYAVTRQPRTRGLATGLAIVRETLCLGVPQGPLPLLLPLAAEDRSRQPPVDLVHRG